MGTNQGNQQDLVSGSALGVTGFLYAFLTALSVGLQDDIVGFLNALAEPQIVIAPFAISWALIGQVALILAFTGVSEYRNGLDADSTEYAATFLIVVALLLAIPEINSWLTGSVFSYILFPLSLGAYGIITAEGFNESSGKSGLIKNRLGGA